jgi:pyruvate dehydrogenase E2 component (dihydrolipoamide acetyltransferase)
MAIEVRMVSLSPTMELGTINRWLKKEGDKVAAGDVLAEVETDKATMPLETFDGGVLLKIIAQEGSKNKVGDLLGVIGKEGEDISALVAKGGASAAAAPAAVPAASAKAESAAQAAPAPAAHTVAAPVISAFSNGGRVKASPLAKKVAKERGIDLAQVPPSGPGGRVIARDVPVSAPVAATTLAAPVPIAAGVGEDIPLSGLRQTIAKRLLQSKQTIPHFYLYSEVSMDRAVAFRDELNASVEEGGVKISFNDLVIKVSAAALAKHPEVNAAFNQTSIRRHGEINIAVAVATEAGLYTPVLRNVDKLSLKQINGGVKLLAGKARDKKLTVAELSGSGFTISNLGMFGVDHFFAIINPPEAAILAVGAIQTKPVVNAAGQVVAGKTMGITLSCDHRVIDGAVGAKFLQTLKDLLEHPAKLLL